MPPSGVVSVVAVMTALTAGLLFFCLRSTWHRQCSKSSSSLSLELSPNLRGLTYTQQQFDLSRFKCSLSTVSSLQVTWRLLLGDGFLSLSTTRAPLGASVSETSVACAFVCEMVAILYSAAAPFRQGGTRTHSVFRGAVKSDASLQTADTPVLFNGLAVTMLWKRCLSQVSDDGVRAALRPMLEAVAFFSSVPTVAEISIVAINDGFQLDPTY